MTFINRDFRSPVTQERHSGLRWAVLAIGCAVLGVVIANTASVEKDPDTLPSFTEKALTSELMARQSFNLSLPELQAQQEIIDEINGY